MRGEVFTFGLINCGRCLGCQFPRGDREGLRVARRAPPIQACLQQHPVTVAPQALAGNPPREQLVNTQQPNA